jgi:hypothetical protein
MGAIATFQFLGKVKGRDLFPRQQPQGIVADFISFLSFKEF